MIDKNVKHPAHYNMGKYEVVDVIEDWKLGFCLGNVIKYVARCNHKGKKVEDLRKAIEYIEFEIAKETTKPDVCENYLHGNHSVQCIRCKHGQEDDGHVYCTKKGDAFFDKKEPFTW